MNLFAVCLGEGSTKCGVPHASVAVEANSYAAQLLLSGSGCLLLTGSGHDPPGGILFPA